MKILARVLFSFLLTIFLFISSCSVNYTFTGADIPADAKTISIAHFSIDPKAALVNPIEGDRFTNVLIATMLTQTSLDIENKNGDLQFEGSIVGYSNTPVAMQSDTEASNRNRITITIKVKYTNTLDPDKNFERSFSNFADFDANENLGDVEEELYEIINETIAQDIFNASIGSW